MTNIEQKIKEVNEMLENGGYEEEMIRILRGFDFEEVFGKRATTRILCSTFTKTLKPEDKYFYLGGYNFEDIITVSEKDIEKHLDLYNEMIEWYKERRKEKVRAGKLRTKVDKLNKKLRDLNLTVGLIHEVEGFDFHSLYGKNAVDQIIKSIGRGEFDPSKKYFFVGSYQIPTSIGLDNIDDHIKSFDYILKSE